MVDNYFDAGLAQLDDGDYEAAVVSFSKALRLALGDLPQILMYRGIAYGNLGDFRRAFADFDECFRLNDRYPDAYNERGNLYRLQNKYRDALQDYSTALALDESFHEARYNRALCYEELGLLDEAERDLTRVIQALPGLAPAYEARGRVRARLRRYEAAISDYQRYLRMGGGREYDNHSEIQAAIIALQVQRWTAWLFRLRRR
jgi:tetratricopeptide (TPR) repeat protein